MSYIARLRGTVEEKGRDYVILDVGGVGYEVLVPGSTLANVGATGEPVTLRTYLYVREDTLALYGFLTGEEKETFERLLGVTGIGPRNALAFLTQFSPAELSGIVERRDAAGLTRVKGIGRKTAERLILELQGKLGPAAAAGPYFPAGPSGDDALEALLSFGITLAEASAALARVPAAGTISDAERVRLALSALDTMRG
jgi:Holliday junction DNA helicase RuvA